MSVKDLSILAMMIFCHIVDDYYLQGILASMKQKDWWKKNAPDKLYNKDYIVALLMHSISWAFSIMAFLVLITNSLDNIVVYGIFITNILIHAIVDDLKANKKKINLIADQSIHMIQIIVTWLIVINL